MTDHELIERMKDKKFYKKATGEKGLIDFFMSGYKKYSGTTAHSVHEPIQLVYYKPDEEGTDEGFGDYGIYAVPLNDKGKAEIDGVVARLKEEDILDDIGAIRYNARGGFFKIDVTENELKEGWGQFRKHSTENVLIYVHSTQVEGGVNSYDKVIYCKGADNSRYIQPISSSAIRNAK